MLNAKNNQHFDEVFNEIKTKYYLNPLSLFPFIHISTYFFMIKLKEN